MRPKPTTTIPIVFWTGSDPVALGLVASLGKPGGNITGVATLAEEVDPKRLEVLHGLVPTVKVIGAFVNPASPIAETQTQALTQRLAGSGCKFVS
jgi:putative tryptophan/tyrosine transport system substrate-binding protein